jgi:hypothetical protein
MVRESATREAKRTGEVTSNSTAARASDAEKTPAACFITTETGLSWLVFADPLTGTRVNRVDTPIWNERMHRLESDVAETTETGFSDLASRIAAELADQQARFDGIALPPLPPGPHARQPRRRGLVRLLRR